MEPSETSSPQQELVLVYFHESWCLCLEVAGREVGYFTGKVLNGRMFREHLGNVTEVLRWTSPGGQGRARQAERDHMLVKGKKSVGNNKEDTS